MATKQSFDYQILSELLDQKFKTQDEKFLRFEMKIDSLETKIDLTIEEDKKRNGRIEKVEKSINSLELRETNHQALCPQNNRIRALEDNQLTNKAVRSFVLKTLMWSIPTSIALTGVILKLIEMI